MASYDTYEQAQRAVDYLSDNRFEVENLSIVGADLQSIEQVTGRLNWWKATLMWAGSGVWLGLFVGLLISLFTPVLGFWLRAILFCALWGAVFGAIFGLISYALQGGKRDFTSVRGLVASRYDVVCEDSKAEQARQMLAGMGTGAQVPRQPEAKPDREEPVQATADGEGTGAPGAAPPG